MSKKTKQTKNTLDNIKLIKFKSDCCKSYKTKKQYCKTCPKLKLNLQNVDV